MESRRRYLGRLGVVLVVVKLALFVSAQDCLLEAGGRVPPFRDNKRFPHLPNGTQSIITSYKFRCCGNITAWLTYVYPGGRRHQGVYDIYFQVWRPSPTVQETGCYSMVGMNVFTSISLGSGGLVSESPEPSNSLTVQPGDVVGYLTISRKGINDGIQLNNSQSVDSVWYDTITGSELLNAGAPNCPFPVGTETNRILSYFTNAAPVLSVIISTFTCPPTPTISQSSSSPSSSSLLPPSMISTTTSVHTQLSNTIPQMSTSLPSCTSITSPAFSVSISISSTPTISEGLSNPVIAVVVSSAILLTLLCTLILAIAIAKVQHKRQRALGETTSIVTDPQVNTLSINIQGNEAYAVTSQIIDAIKINTESNLAYDAVKKENGVTAHSSQGTDEIALTGSHVYESVSTYSEAVNAIAIAKVQHKRQKALGETTSIVTDPQVNTLSMNIQGNEAYALTSRIIDAIKINTESNLAYDAVKKEIGVTAHSSQGTDEIALTESHVYEPVSTYSELSHPEEHYYYLREVHHPVSQM